MMAAWKTPAGVRLDQLLEGLSEPGDCAGRSVSGVTLDSRQVEPGALFLACSGRRGHGLDHIDQALARGAAAVFYEPHPSYGAPSSAHAGVPIIPVQGLAASASLIASRFYGDPSSDLFVVGFTGTNGKTSCSQFLAQSLTEERCAIIGTLGNGFPGALESGSHTTPDPVGLQELLARFRAQGARSVAMEVSSHALEQGRAAAVRFGAAVFTNLSRDHLDYHGSMAAYGASKERLFNMPGVAAGVVNMDDPFGRDMIGRIPSTMERIGYGLAPCSGASGIDRWLQGAPERIDADGMTIRFSGSWGPGEFSTTLLGRFNASNLLAVLAVLLQMGFPPEEAVRRISAVQTVAGRMERYGGDGVAPLVIVDYAHTPDALEQVLAALRPHAAGRLICLFGCGGDRDKGKRPLMGAIAERLADRVVVTDDNPRFESNDRIVADILQGMERPGGVTVEHDRAKAIRLAIAKAKPGDLVLISGKGHETSQQIGELRIPFSDREQVLKALQEGEG